MTTTPASPIGTSGGNIILQCRTATPNPLALETAVVLAKALRLDIKSVFLEDVDVLKLSSMPFAVEISSTGRRLPIVDRPTMERKMKVASTDLRQNLGRLIKESSVTCEFTTVRSEAVGALVPFCSDQCIVVTSETFDHSDMVALAHLFEQVTGLAGALLVGPLARRRSGPIVVVESDTVNDSSVYRVAHHLVQHRNASAIHTIPQNSLTAINANHFNPSLVIAARGENLRPGQVTLRTLVNQLEAPLLLLRASSLAI